MAERCCTKCGQVKPVDEFYTGWYRCKVCTRASSKERYQAYRDYWREYEETHKTRREDYNRAYYRAHRDELLASVKEYNKTLKGQAVQKAVHHKRRAQAQGADNADNALVEQLILEATACAYCGEVFPNSREKTLEHVMPLSRGGEHTLDNLTVVCKDCNLSKGSKTLDEWLR